MPTYMEDLASVEALDLDCVDESYLKVRALRRKARDFYIGEEIVKEREEEYLIRLPNEGNASYNRRLKLAVYDNWPQVVMLYRLSMQWEVPPKRELPEQLQPFEGNVDGGGMDANTFFRSVNEDAGVDGMNWVMVDKPRRPRNEKGEEVPAGSKAQEDPPYAVSIPAEDVLDWSFDSEGNLEYAVVKQDIRIKPGPGQEAELSRRRLVWTRKEWGLFEAKDTWEKRTKSKDERAIAGQNGNWLLIDEGVNAIGVVPLVPFYGVYVHHGLGLPAIKDVLGLQMGIYNKSSHRDKAEISACNVIPWAISPEKPGKVEIGEDTMPWLSSMNEQGVAGNASFGMLEAQGTGIEACRRTEDAYIARLMQIGALQAHGRLPSGQVQSAEGIKMEGRQFSGSLASVAEHLEACELQVWRLFWRHAAGARATFSEKTAQGDSIVVYNKDFDEDRLTETFLDILQKARSAGNLSLETFLRALNASRKLPFEIDAKKEISAIEADADRSTMPGFDSGGAAPFPPEPDPEAATADQETADPATQ